MMTPAGTFKTHVAQTLSSETPKWSPDGSRLVFSMTSQLHVVDVFAMCGLILPSGRAGMCLSCAELRFGGNDLAKRKFIYDSGTPLMESYLNAAESANVA